MNINKIFRLAIVICLLIMIYSVFGCARKIVDQQSKNNIGISIPILSHKLAAATDHAELTVNARDFDSTLVFPLIQQFGALVGEASVPTGNQRTFTINAYAKDNVLLYTGSEIVNVSTGITSLTIALRPMVPMLSISPHFQIGHFIESVILPLSDTFAVEIHAYNIDSLRDISFNLNYDLGPFNLVGITAGSMAGDSGRISSEGGSGSIWLSAYIAGPFLGEFLTDSLGQAHIATLTFSTYDDWNSDTARVNFSLTPQSIYSLSGDSLTTSNIFSDDAEVLLLRIPLPTDK